MFEALAEDTTSGATSLTRSAADILSNALIDSRAADPGEFWNELEAACRELTSAQREMAPLINLAGTALRSAERLVLSGVGPETLKRAVALELGSFVSEMDDQIEALAREGAAALPPCSVIATLSASECVSAVLLGARGSGRTLEIIAAESEPAKEGIAQAERLRSEGIPVTVVPDRELAARVPSVDLVLLGADRISQDEFVGKRGVLETARAASDAGVPCIAAATEQRFLSSALAPRSEASIEGGSLLETAPLSLLTGVVTGDGLLTPTEVAERVTHKPVPPALLRVLFDRSPRTDL